MYAELGLFCAGPMLVAAIAGIAAIPTIAEECFVGCEAPSVTSPAGFAFKYCSGAARNF
jgi:hypothetical protein